MRDLIDTHYKEAKESNDPEIINSFLIELGKNPSEEYLSLLDFFINDLEKELYEKIKLNLIYVIGEIGNIIPLTENYLQILHETYYKSDRWVRNEIIQAIDKIAKTSNINDDLIKMIGIAIRDDYKQIKINTLKTLLNFEQLPGSVLKHFLYVLNSKDSEILEACRTVLEKFSLDSHVLFNILDSSENYKILKLRAIRFLLLVQFQSLLNLEEFRKLILNSDWEPNYKEDYLKELETLERILVKNL